MTAPTEHNTDHEAMRSLFRRNSEFCVIFETNRDQESRYFELARTVDQLCRAGDSTYPDTGGPYRLDDTDRLIMRGLRVAHGDRDDMSQVDKESLMAWNAARAILGATPHPYPQSHVEARESFHDPVLWQEQAS